MVSYLAPDVHLPGRLGDTTDDYLRWKAEVARVRFLPEYKLRKLWRLNYSPLDIAHDRHHEVYPPRVKRVPRGTLRRERRGAALSGRAIRLSLARALLRDIRRILAQHRLEPRELALARDCEERFARLVEALKAKPAR